MTEDERIKVIQTAVGAIGKCTEELKTLEEVSQGHSRKDLDVL